MPRTRARLAGWAALLMIAWGGVMFWRLRAYPFPHEFHHDVDSPGIALEESHKASDIEAVLHRDDQRVKAEEKQKAKDSLRQNNRLDLVFIPIYAFFLWSLGRVFRERTPLLTLLILGTAFFDYWEDWRIFRALDGENPAIDIPSLIKWALLALVLLGTGVILMRSVSTVYSLATKRLMGIGYVIAGLLLLIALGGGDELFGYGYSLIEVGALLYAQLTVIQMVGLLSWKP